MDNQEQIKEIIRYRQYLCRISQTDIDIEKAAIIWISKYARAWRTLHSQQKNSNQ